MKTFRVYGKQVIRINEVYEAESSEDAAAQFEMDFGGPEWDEVEACSVDELDEDGYLVGDE